MDLAEIILTAALTLLTLTMAGIFKRIFSMLDKKADNGSVDSLKNEIHEQRADLRRHEDKDDERFDRVLDQLTATNTNLSATNVNVAALAARLDERQK